MTDRGSYLLGNPNAPVKLVEYASITCPHCAEFTEVAATPLRERYVRSGQVSHCSCDFEHTVVASGAQREGADGAA